MVTTYERLYGATTGTTRESILEFATFTATDYYRLPADQISVTLTEVTVLTVGDGSYGLPDHRVVTGYAAEFVAEVIEP